MIVAPVPADDAERVADLRRHQILDTPEEEEFNDLVLLASRICSAPISLISLIDSNRQWLKAKSGIDATETERDVSFCSHTILQNDIFIVPDATCDERFFDNPYVTGDPEIRFYAGIPLVSTAGYKLGSLCVIDRIPRNLAPDQQEALRILGKQACRQFELRLKNTELERISQAQKRIISVMAHDIRSPLASLSSLFHLYHTHTINRERFEEFVVMADGQLDSTLKLLENLVEWGKIHLHELNFNAQHIALTDQVQTVFEELATLAAIKENKLLNETGDARLTINPHVIRFILRNLISNALKFTDKGTITVHANRQAGKLLIAVQDTGVGMSQTVSSTLFSDVGKQVRKGTRNEQGSGLGLSLVQQFVETLNGSIRVESTEGRGTAVSILLEC
ncbi:MAG: GAF domain-containing sensor histidine kinase [Chitinophagaceae bacterium]